ncbi:hypothetical protein [Roseibium salinum]|uniref:Secreted protein n=1 Tax=Roseibium salinum TaxID=1604349 RepID=A0ABT3QVP6_9HYPH|nr:hypothetical protein [Roseibium sp. DSM 29163]MCX2720985.1 hypothetical protein [Roseibium sp. DSM 29163]MDN3722443.1 hypothetical protein [Roseibium salinum]
MTRKFRIFMFVVLAAFAAGTVAHATNAVTMNTKMTLAVIDGADMGDCQNCPDGNDDALACDIDCLSPILAVVPSGQPGLLKAGTLTESVVPQSATGHTGRPDPHPPRFTILS